MKKLLVLSSLAFSLLLTGCPNKDESATTEPSSAVSAAVGDNVASPSAAATTAP